LKRNFYCEKSSQKALLQCFSKHFPDLKNLPFGENSTNLVAPINFDKKYFGLFFHKRIWSLCPAMPVAAENRVTRWVCKKFAQDRAQTVFSYNQCINFTEEKSFKFTRVNHCPMGENSPNLVTVLPIKGDKI
jgi:hypothetical protein